MKRDRKHVVPKSRFRETPRFAGDFDEARRTKLRLLCLCSIAAFRLLLPRSNESRWNSDRSSYLVTKPMIPFAVFDVDDSQVYGKDAPWTCTRHRRVWITIAITGTTLSLTDTVQTRSCRIVNSREFTANRTPVTRDNDTRIGRFQHGDRLRARSTRRRPDTISADENIANPIGSVPIGAKVSRFSRDFYGIAKP